MSPTTPRSPPRPRAARLALLALLVASAAATTPACKQLRRRRGAAPAAARYTGPRLGAPGSVIAATRVLNPPRAATPRPFDAVVVLPRATLGLAAGALFRAAADAPPGGERVDPFAGAEARALAPAGGDVVYALFDGVAPFVARSDDAGQTWTRGAAVAGERLPPPPAFGAVVNPEATAGLAAAGGTVAFWLGEAVLVSRDGGAHVAPVALGGVPRSVAVGRSGTLVATARLDPPPEGDAIGVVRVDAAGAAQRVRVLAPTDPCAGGRVYALATGGFALGGERLLLGLCAEVSRDDGRRFAPAPGDPASWADVTSLAASPSGVLLRARPSPEGVRVVEASRDDGASFEPLAERAAGLPLDVAPDGTLAVGLTDALARLAPGAPAPAGAAFARELAADRRYTLAFAAARGAIAALDPRGALAVVDAGDDGPRVRHLESPCRFPTGTPDVRDLPLVALDGRGRVCCAGLPGADTRAGPPRAACADLREATPAWRPLAHAPAALGSGEGAIALAGGESDHAASCLLAGDAVTAPRPLAVLGLSPDDEARDVSCAEGGAAVATVLETQPMRFAYRLVAGAPRARPLALEPSAGLHAHLLARANGALVAATETRDGFAVQVFRAGRARPLARWLAPPGTERPSPIAPWDDATSVLTVRDALLVVTPARVHARRFAAGERYVAVARIGDALVGATRDGRFVVLGPR